MGRERGIGSEILEKLKTSLRITRALFSSDGFGVLTLDSGLRAP